MKILCLHPWGTSGLIFEKQLGALSDMLGRTHEYVYINGSIPCAPARDLPSFVRGPYYAWYEGLSSSQCQEAHDIIAETIEEEGPFDGVVGFSQGASLAISYILHHELRRPGVPCPFRFALFFCSNLVVSPDPKFNADKLAKYSRYYKPAEHGVTKVGNVTVDEVETEEEDDEDGKEGQQDATRPATVLNTNGIKPKAAAPKHRALLLLPKKREALVEELVRLVQEMSRNLAGQVDESRHSWPKDPKPEDFPRLMHPLTVKARVPIPSVHVISRGDPLMDHAELAVRLCDKKRTRVVYFNGVHRIPTAPTTLRTITAAVEWAMQEGQLMWRGHPRVHWRHLLSGE